MINFYGEAETGKTKKLIEYAYDNNITVVCENSNKMIEKAHGYGIVGLSCIEYMEYIDEVIKRSEGYKDTSEVKYMIDDIGRFISYLSPETIGFSTLIERN